MKRNITPMPYKLCQYLSMRGKVSINNKREGRKKSIRKGALPVAGWGAVVQRVSRAAVAVSIGYCWGWVWGEFWRGSEIPGWGCTWSSKKEWNCVSENHIPKYVNKHACVTGEEKKK